MQNSAKRQPVYDINDESRRLAAIHMLHNPDALAANCGSNELPQIKRIQYANLLMRLNRFKHGLPYMPRSHEGD